MTKSIPNEIVELIQSHQKELISILVATETYKMAEDEIDRSLRLFKSLDREQSVFLHKFNIDICSYLPLNQPLYSFALNVIVPSLVCKDIYYRPPQLLRDLHNKLHKIFSNNLENVHICAIGRKDFFLNYCSNSDLIIFTGKYENAVELKNQLSNKTAMIYNGSAVNPVVVTADADLNKAVNDCILARLFNSGQDCMAPACIFIERKVASAFLNCLSNSVKFLSVGDNKSSNTDIGQLINKQSIEEFLDFKKEFCGFIYLDSDVRVKDNIMSPAIFYWENTSYAINNIYYAPYFVIVAFDNISEVQNSLNSEFCERYAGYISLYGETAINAKWMSGNNKLVLLKNSTLFDYEDGNKEFGGYGIGCNFVYSKNRFEVHPILLLREIKSLFQ